MPRLPGEEEEVNRRRFIKGLIGFTAAFVAGPALLTPPPVPEVAFTLTSAPVVAPIRKLRCRYTLEAAQNLKAAYGVPNETDMIERMQSALLDEIEDRRNGYL
jgi:hypothetical protein